MWYRLSNKCILHRSLLIPLQGLTIEERVEHLEELSKIKTLRTCHELAQHGITTSGKYNIDPDGDQIGNPKRIKKHGLA